MATKNIFLIAAVCFFACQPSQQQSSPTPPNMILIIADDMAWDDSGAYGHPSIKTPNLDRLATEGIRFERAFLTTSSCSPSRSSIITGRYPHATGAEQLHLPLPAEQITFVEKLRQAGYWTVASGKWHLGQAIRDRFDLIIPPGKNPLLPDTVTSKPAGGAEGFVPALQMRPKDQPFFAWFASTDPHRGYQEGTIAEPHRSEDAIIPPYMPEEERVKEDFAMYYDEISRLDSVVGEVMRELDNQGISENTLILFISDNGRPFPRDKTTLYDGGIKTPWIMRWPEKITAGTAHDQLVSSVDIAPTLLSLAGLDQSPTFQGVDISPLFLGDQQPIREYIFAEAHWHDFEDHRRAIRNKDIKYIRNYYTDIAQTPPADALRSPTFEVMKEKRDNETLTEAQMRIFETPRPGEELYDLREDPYELHNLIVSAEYQEILEELRSAMDRWQAETQDTLPARRSADEFDRETGLPLDTWQKMDRKR